MEGGQTSKGVVHWHTKNVSQKWKLNTPKKNLVILITDNFYKLYFSSKTQQKWYKWNPNKNPGNPNKKIKINKILEIQIKKHFLIGLSSQKIQKPVKTKKKRNPNKNPGNPNIKSVKSLQ
jgi:hypothetical protein